MDFHIKPFVAMQQMKHFRTCCRQNIKTDLLKLDNLQKYSLLNYIRYEFYVKGSKLRKNYINVQKYNHKCKRKQNTHTHTNVRETSPPKGFKISNI